jgi:hypothetical protein
MPYERIPKYESPKIQPLRMYASDLDQLADLLAKVGAPPKITVNERYRIDRPSEDLGSVPVRKIKSIAMSASKYDAEGSRYAWVELENWRASVRINDDAPQDLVTMIQVVEDLLRSRQRPWAAFVRRTWYLGILPMVGSFISAIALSDRVGIRLGAGLAIASFFGIVWLASASLIDGYRYCILERKMQGRSWLDRNKDQIFVSAPLAIFTGVIAALLAGLLGTH